MKYIKLPVQILRQKGKYIAYTPALDLSTSGKTKRQALSRFNEIVDIFLEEIIESKTADRVLRDLGWEKIDSGWQPPVIVSQQPIKFSMNALA